MLILGLSETIERLAVENSVCWNGHVLRRENGHALRRALDFWSKEEREAKEDMKKTGRRRKCEGWFENGRCTLPFKVECWRKSDCCWVEVNLDTLTCWGYYGILNIGVSFSIHVHGIGSQDS